MQATKPPQNSIAAYPDLDTPDALESKLPNTDLRLERGQSPDDFTCYLDRSQEGSKEEALTRVEGLLSCAKPLFSYSDSVNLVRRNKSKSEYRSLICPCFRRKHYSITLRATTASGGSDKRGRKGLSPSQLLEHSNERSAFDPIEIDKNNAKRPGSDKFLFNVNYSVKALHDIIFSDIEKRTGLVVITGSTGTGKSSIVQGLIFKYLTTRICSLRRPEDRRPHLVTIEDPIEKFYYASPKIARHNGLDYTPRQMRLDVRSLNEGLRDCLRQTPAAVYVGETRDPKEWPALVDFAGTGHLVFTTCHAGSLTEAMTAIRDAVGGDTAIERSALANRLLAVIHLHQLPNVESATTKKKAVVPCLWLRTSAGINAMTSDGLAAILPHAENGKSHPKNRYCYGHTYFAETILETIEKEDTTITDFRSDLIRKAIQLDLGGM